MAQERLQNYFNTIINNQRLSHAYILVGALGSGKTELAIWIAKKIFCLEQQSPCHKCAVCQRIEHREFLDVVFVEPEGLSIKVEQIRQLKLDTAFSSLENSKKVYIISQAEKMSASASNSLLKMMEEPSGERYFFLLTDKVNAIMPTILSRAQIMRCDKVNALDIKNYLLAQQINEQISYIISHLTQSKEQAIEMANEEFIAFSQSMIQWGKLLLNRNMQSFIYVQRQLIQHFSDRTMALIGYDILFLLFSDVIKAKTIENGITPLNEKREKVVINQEDIDNILKAKRMLQDNVSAQACYEWLALQICGR